MSLPWALNPVQSLSPAASSHTGLGTARSLGERRRMPGRLPWALVPSPSLCFSAGLWGHPPRLCRVPGVDEAWLPGQDTPDAPDCRVLGEDKPQTPGPGWTRAAPRARGEGCAAVPCLPCSSLGPRAWSCILLPCLQARTPQGLFSRPLSPPCPQGAAEGDPDPCGPWQWDRGVSASPGPLCLRLSLNLSPTGLRLGDRNRRGKGGAGRRDWSSRLGRLWTSPAPLCSL